MNICCIYSTSEYSSVEKPLSTPMDIPFGIAFIATALQKQGYDPKLLVHRGRSNTPYTLRGRPV